MNKNSLSKIVVCVLIVLFLVRVVLLPGAGSNLEYSQFIAEVQRGRVNEVKLGANPQFLPASFMGTKAFIKTANHECKIVDIPPGNEPLIKLIVDNVRGDIEIPPKNDWHIWYEELSRIFIPCLLFLFGISELLYIITNRKQLLMMRSYVAVIMAFVVLVMFAHQYWDRAKIHNPLPYAQFIEEVRDGKVANVGLSPDHNRAVVDGKDGYRDIVNLPPDDRLDNILSQNIKGKIYTIPDDRFNAIVIKNNAKVKGFKNHST